MKVSKSSTGTITVQAEGEDAQSTFKELAALEEVFCQRQCGKCGSTDLRFVVRNHDDNDFYELHCLGKDEHNRPCRARFTFGANKKGGGLFPHRKNDKGEYLPDNGWTVYKKPETK